MSLFYVSLFKSFSPALKCSSVPVLSLQGQAETRNKACLPTVSIGGMVSLSVCLKEMSRPFPPRGVEFR